MISGLLLVYSTIITPLQACNLSHAKTHVAKRSTERKKISLPSWTLSPSIETLLSYSPSFPFAWHWPCPLLCYESHTPKYPSLPALSRIITRLHTQAMCRKENEKSTQLLVTADSVTASKLFEWVAPPLAWLMSFPRAQLSFFMDDDPCHLNPTANLDALIDIYFLVSEGF